MKVLKYSLIVSVIIPLLFSYYAKSEETLTINKIGVYNTGGYINIYPAHTADNTILYIYVFSFDHENYYSFFSDDLSETTIIPEGLFIANDRGCDILFEKVDEQNKSIAFYNKMNGFFSDFIYEMAAPLSEDIFVVSINDKVYYINSEAGQIIYQFEEGDQLTDVCYFVNGYSCINNFTQFSMKIVDREGSISKIDNRLSVYSISEEGYIVNVDADTGLYGICNVNGEIVFENTWNKILSIDHGKALMQDAAGKWGILSVDKRIVMPCSLELKEPVNADFESHYVIVKTVNDSWIVVSDDGRILAKE